MSWLLDQLAKEWNVIKSAPLVFSVTWAIGALLIWWFVNWLYSERLKVFKETVDALRNRQQVIVNGKTLLRKLSEWQSNELLRLLSEFKNHSGSRITIHPIAEVIDSEAYGWQLDGIFKAAGWECNLEKISVHQHTNGIWICGGNNFVPNNAQLCDIFKKAKIEVSGDPELDVLFHIVIGPT